MTHRITLMTCLMASPALAGPPCPSVTACAEAGSAAFAGGRLEDALRHFEQGQTYAPSADFEWNIAHLLGTLGRDDEAIPAYEKFVARRPDDPRRALADRMLALVQARQEGPVRIRVDAHADGTPVVIRDVKQSQSGQSPMTAEVEPRGTLRVMLGPPPAIEDPLVDERPVPDYETYSYIALGAGGALAVTSIVLAIIAADHREEADRLTEQAREEGPETTDIRVADVQAERDSAAALDVGALITGGLGLVGLTAGALLLAIDAELPAEGTIRVGPAGVAASWSF